MIQPNVQMCIPHNKKPNNQLFPNKISQNVFLPIHFRPADLEVFVSYTTNIYVMRKMQRNHVRAWKSTIVVFVLIIQLHKDRMNRLRVYTRDAVHAMSHQYNAQAEDHRPTHPRRIIIDADHRMCSILSET